MSKAVRVGVVGAGAIAQVAHLVTLSRREDVNVVGICDADLAKAQALAGRFGIPNVFDDIDDLLRYATPDAVVVCTPNHLHEVHVEMALTRGAHVLCERPLALSSAGVERLTSIRASADRALLVGMNNRYRSDVGAIRRFLAGGELGRLNAIRGRWHIHRPAGQVAGWRERRAESGGGAMLDLGLPLVDLGLWLSGCPAAKRVSAVYGTRGDGEVEDSACALVRCEREHSIFVDVAWRYVGREERFSLEVVGDEGSANTPPLVVFKEMHGAPVDVTPDSSHVDAFSVSYREEWTHFLNIVRGRAPIPDLRDQILLHRVVEAAERSAAEGGEVSL